MIAWWGTQVCFIDPTWSKQRGRRPLRFSKPGTINCRLISRTILQAPGDRMPPCALFSAITISGFLLTGLSRKMKPSSGKEPIRLLLSDVDGTLVTQEKILTAEARGAAEILAGAGILFAITSGRPPRGMQTLVGDLHITTVVAGFNGGVYTT